MKENREWVPCGATLHGRCCPSSFQGCQGFFLLECQYTSMPQLLICGGAYDLDGRLSVVRLHRLHRSRWRPLLPTIDAPLLRWHGASATRTELRFCGTRCAALFTHVKAPVLVDGWLGWIAATVAAVEFVPRKQGASFRAGRGRGAGRCHAGRGLELGLSLSA
jgi:hypothetical protein